MITNINVIIAAADFFAAHFICNTPEPVLRS